MARQSVIKVKGEAQADGRVFLSRLPGQLKTQWSHLALWNDKWLAPAANRATTDIELTLRSSFVAFVKISIVSQPLLERALEAAEFQKKRAFSLKGQALKEDFKQWVTQDLQNGGGGVHRITNRKNAFTSHRVQGVVVDGVYTVDPDKVVATKARPWFDRWSAPLAQQLATLDVVGKLRAKVVVVVASSCPKALVETVAVDDAPQVGLPGRFPRIVGSAFLSVGDPSSPSAWCCPRGPEQTSEHGNSIGVVRRPPERCRGRRHRQRCN